MASFEISQTEGKHAALDELKLFTIVPFFIPWYRSQESKNVFPIILNEIGDLNASRTFIPGIIERNPFFDHTDITYLIAKQDGKPVGRIAAFVDSHYNQEQREKHGETRTTGWIGLFECIEDSSLAEQLFEAADDYLRKKGCDLVIGPAKFNANGPVGLLVKGFEHEPYFMEPYNAPYYPELFEAQGFEKLDDWFSIRAYEDSMETVKRYIDKAKRLEEIIKKSETRGKVMREITLRYADFKHIKSEIPVLYDKYNGNWGEGDHPQFTTLTYPECRKLANDIKTITKPEYVLILELDGRPIGISASVPNVNEKILEWDRQHPGYQPSPRFLSPKDISRDISIFGSAIKGARDNSFESLRILILGVDGNYRGMGLDGKLFSTGFEIAYNNGIKRASMSQLAERNPAIVNPLTKMVFGEESENREKDITCRVYSHPL